MVFLSQAMNTKILEQRPASRNELTEEVRRLRSLVIGLVGRDSEGAYRPEYVRRLLALTSKPSTHVFKGSTSLLKELSEVV
jgi:hypothetical protein